MVKIQNNTYRWYFIILLSTLFYTLVIGKIYTVSSSHSDYTENRVSFAIEFHNSKGEEFAFSVPPNFTIEQLSAEMRMMLAIKGDLPLQVSDFTLESQISIPSNLQLSLNTSPLGNPLSYFNITFSNIIGKMTQEKLQLMVSTDTRVARLMNTITELMQLTKGCPLKILYREQIITNDQYHDKTLGELGMTHDCEVILQGNDHFPYSFRLTISMNDIQIPFLVDMESTVGDIITAIKESVEINKNDSLQIMYNEIIITNKVNYNKTLGELGIKNDCELQLFLNKGGNKISRFYNKYTRRMKLCDSTFYTRLD